MDFKTLSKGLLSIGAMLGLGAGVYISGIFMVILIGKLSGVAADTSLGLDSNITANVSALASNGITFINTATSGTGLVVGLFSIVLVALIFGADKFLKDAFSKKNSGKGM